MKTFPESSWCGVVSLWSQCAHLKSQRCITILCSFVSHVDPRRKSLTHVVTFLKPAIEGLHSQITRRSSSGNCKWTWMHYFESQVFDTGVKYVKKHLHMLWLFSNLPPSRDCTPRSSVVQSSGNRCNSDSEWTIFWKEKTWPTYM